MNLSMPGVTQGDSSARDDARLEPFSHTHIEQANVRAQLTECVRDREQWGNMPTASTAGEEDTCTPLHSLPNSVNACAAVVNVHL